MRRAAAFAIDLFIGAALGLLLSQSRVGIFFAERAVVMLHIGEPGTIWKGPIPMLMGYAGTFVYVLPLSLLVVFLVAPATGRSLGQRVARVPVAPHERAWRRAATRTMPLWGLVVALIAGSWQLAILFLAFGLALGLASLVR